MHLNQWSLSAELSVTGQLRTGTNISVAVFALCGISKAQTSTVTNLSVCFSSKVDQIQDIVTGNPTVFKMVVNFNREARGHNALRQLLAPVVKDIIEDKTLGINTNPVDVYMTWVNQLETSTGQVRYDGKWDEAVGQLIQHIRYMTHLCPNTNWCVFPPSASCHTQ